MSWPATSPASRGYGTAWRKLREVVMERDHYLCQTCSRKGVLTVAREVDHIVPKAERGTDALTNLKAICTPCHQAKTMREQGRDVKPTIGLDGWEVE